MLSPLAHPPDPQTPLYTPEKIEERKRLSRCNINQHKTYKKNETRHFLAQLPLPFFQGFSGTLLIVATAHICTALGSPAGCAALSCNLSSTVLMCPMPETFTLEDRLLMCAAWWVSWR